MAFDNQVNGIETADTPAALATAVTISLEAAFRCGLEQSPAYGRRVPEAFRSQREFRAAVILLIDETDPTVDSKLLESLSADVPWFSFPGTDESEENNFYEATGGRATLKMDGLAQFLKDRE